jgi:catechol 2,3-dioxygenase-like lactoylglutathione lyase family enzyme
MLRRRLPLVLGALVLLLGSPAGRPALDAASPRVLWQIGKQDASNAELALAPKDYRSFKDDPLFVVGASDARQAWPYVHPGPDDAWAGSRAHAFTVLFGLKSAPPAGACRLVIDLLQTHPSEPPHVEARVNGFVQQKALPKGSPNARPDEVPTEGHPEGWALDFPCDALRAGNNAVVLTTASGSWMLYDDVRMEAPEGVETAPVAPETVVTRARALPVWEKSGDASVQPIELTVRRVGPDIEAVIRAGAGEGERVSLKQGFQEVEARVPASEEARRVDVAVEVAGQAPVTESIDAQPPRLREMWLLPHSHVDIGYTHRQEEVVGIQVGNLEKAMRLAQSSAGNPEGARFKWNPEAVWTIDHFLQKASPAQREAFVKAVRDGEVGVDGLFANLLTGLCRPEELLQAVRPALKVADLTGVPVSSAATCDVPGWTWGLVPVLAQAGVKYFAIGPNAGPSEAGRRTVGLYHLAWEVDTLAELARLRDVLSERGALVGASDHGTTKSLYAQDPDGNEFEVAWVVPLRLLDDAAIESRDRIGHLDLPKELARYGPDTEGGVGISHVGATI